MGRTQTADRRQTGAHEIADRLVSRIRNPDRRQFAGPMQLRQADRQSSCTWKARTVLMPICPSWRSYTTLVSARSGSFWGRPNIFGHGVPFAWPRSPHTGPGLTPEAKDFRRDAGRCGVDDFPCCVPVLDPARSGERLVADPQLHAVPARKGGPTERRRLVARFNPRG
jgi:hypothetical protein